MPLIATRGAASAQGFGEFAQSAAPVYIEDVFSTYLYTGTGATQTITNGIDLSGKGGLVWLKARNVAKFNGLIDTVRGVNSCLVSSSTSAQNAEADSGISSFNSTGFTLNTVTDFNGSTNTLVSWTFRKQPKFFDVVTFTKSSSPQTISHNLGSTPGCIFIKRTDSTGAWLVAHRGYTGGITAGYTLLNTTDAFTSNANAVTAVDSTTFTLGSAVVSGDFVAYLFAHDAGGFGLTGTDNVISCGSFTTDASRNATITLGYEPQWVLIKQTSAANSWGIYDTMRGWAYSNQNYLIPNDPMAEGTINASNFVPTATGFNVSSPYENNATYIYIAIRRGPMKVPTSGTSVFSPNTANTSAGTPVVTNFPVDLSISVAINGDTRYFSDRLRGVNSTGQTANQPWVASNSTGAELTNASIPRGWDNTQILVPPYYAGGPTVWWNFKRAPSFFDEVCYTGTGSATTQTHNLGVAPELVIIKSRSNAIVWVVGNTAIGFSNYLLLNATDASASGSNVFNSTAPTSTVFSIGAGSGTNQSGATYVAYLFATLAGVSKVGSYTGTATTKQIDCGFTGGARFVLIKRTDSTGSWYVWDVARGISSGNDPYLLLNSTAAEVTSTDYIDAYSAGFEISSTAPAEINASGGSFIFLAIS